MGFLSKIFKSKLFKVAAPIALGFTGLSPLAAAAAGAGIGAVGGGGIKGAALGALGGYAGAGGLGTAAGTSVPLTTNGIPGGVGQIASKGSGILGSLGKAGTALSSVFGGGSGAGSMLANVYSGMEGNETAEKIAKSQQKGVDKALTLQKTIYDQTRGDLSPFVASGSAANNRLSALMGLGGDTASAIEALKADPGYQFRLDQGTQAMNRSLGAKGSLFSGKALKAAQEYGQGLADQSYQDTWRRLYDTSNAGQSAAAGMGNFGQAYAGNAGNLYQTSGDITANKLTNQSNITNQALSNVFGAPVGNAGNNTVIIGYDQRGNPIYGRAS